MDSTERKPSIQKKIALVGGPCSGKSTVLEEVRQVFNYVNDQEGDQKVYLDVLPEVWGVYRHFAHFLFSEFAKGNGKITNKLLRKLMKDLKTHMEWGRFTAELADEGVIPESAYFQVMNNNPSMRIPYEKGFGTYSLSFWDTYFVYNFGFMKHIQGIDDEDKLRSIIQRDLWRAQKELEIRKIMQFASWINSVVVIDGGLPNILAYWPDLDLASYQQFLERYHFRYESPEEVINQYDVVIVLETLAMLDPSYYAQFFEDGVRLDSPEHAREVHHRVLDLVGNHPNCLILPAVDTVEKKATAVLEEVVKLTKDLVE